MNRIHMDEKSSCYHTNACLRSDEIRALCVDNDGNIWAGTMGGGISVWDGNVWFTHSVSDDLAGNSVRALAVTPDNRIWATTEHGVSIWDGSHWATTITEENHLDAYPKALAVSPNGEVWAASEFSVYFWTGTKWHCIDSYSNHPWDISSLAIGLDGRVWVGSYEDGVSVWDKTSWVHYTVDDGLGDKTVRALAVAPDGCIWAATEGGTSVWDGSRWNNYRPEDSLYADSTWSLAISPEGQIWVGANQGIRNWNGERWESHKIRQMTTTHITALAIASDGCIWAGSLDKGIGVWDGVSWITFTSENLDCVWADTLTMSSDGRIWAGSGEGLKVWNGIQWKIYTSADGLSDNYIRAIVSDSHNKTWVGSKSGGVSVWDGISWKNYSIADGLASNTIHSLCVDSEDHVWAGTNQGISQWDGNHWTHGEDEQQKYSFFDYKGAVTSIICHDERLLIGTWGSGIGIYHKNKWEYYSTRNGLTDDYIRVIVIDHNDCIWIGTDQGGVNMWNGKKWTAYTSEQGLCTNRIYCLMVAPDNSVWAGTSEGIFVWNENQWLPHLLSSPHYGRNTYALLLDSEYRVWASSDSKVCPLRNKNGNLEYLTTEESMSNRKLDRNTIKDPSISKINQKVEIMHCRSCGILNSEDSLYCSHCGALLIGIVCPHCYTLVQKDSLFCSNCGIDLTRPFCCYTAERARQLKKGFRSLTEYCEITRYLPASTEEELFALLDHSNHYHEINIVTIPIAKQQWCIECVQVDSLQIESGAFIGYQSGFAIIDYQTLQTHYFTLVEIASIEYENQQFTILTHNNTLITLKMSFLYRNSWEKTLDALSIADTLFRAISRESIDPGTALLRQDRWNKRDARTDRFHRYLSLLFDFLTDQMPD